MKIGIPRALIYWKRPYFWETFFENLGFEVLLSPQTNKEIVELGTKIADPETCFSTKVYWGHLLWLDGKCDFIFIPRLKTKTIPSLNPLSESNSVFEYCPKFFGLPDLAQALIKTPILTETFDERKATSGKTLKKLGKKLKKSSEGITKANQIALLREKGVKEKEKQNFSKKISSERPKIILVSHPYNLFDEYVNLRIRDKLERLGAEVIFIDEVPISVNLHPNQRHSASTIKFHWEFGKEIIEKIEAVLKYPITGAVELSSFQCGCDAVLKEFVEKEFRMRKIPFLYLIIDEQTGEAGLQTRLEAFIDTLK